MGNQLMTWELNPQVSQALRYTRVSSSALSRHIVFCPVVVWLWLALTYNDRMKLPILGSMLIFLKMIWCFRHLQSVHFGILYVTHLHPPVDL